MDDAKVKIGVEIAGAGERAIQRLQKQIDDALGKTNKATKENTKATSENSETAGGNTKAKNENIDATNNNADATSRATRATQQNTDATEENTEAQEALAEEMGVVIVTSEQLEDAIKKINKLEKLQKGELSGVREATMGVYKAQSALENLMSGNLVGAFKDAIGSAVDFGKSVLLNPMLLAIGAVTTAIAAMTKGWIEASEAKEKYTRNNSELSDMAERLRFARNGGEYSESELKEKIAKAQEKADRLDEEAEAKQDQATRANEAYGKQGGFSRFVDSSIGFFFDRFNNKSVASQGKRAELLKQEAETATKAAEDAYKELDGLQDELDRVQGGKAGKARAASNSASEYSKRYENFRREQKYDLVEAEAEGKNPGSGRLESLRARLKDATADRDKAFATIGDPQERLSLMEKVLSLQRQVTEEEKRQAEEEKRQAETEKKRNMAQEEWLRGKKLAKMEAKEIVEYVQKEIDALKKSPRTAENEAKMRGLIDQRDRAQAQIDKDTAASEKDAATKKEDAADKAADLYNKQQDFFRRNDTDAQKLRQNSQYLKEAKERGDTSAMLELMMHGESIADNYQEPMSKWEQRKADRRAKKDAKAAQRAAKAYQRQVRAIERDWKAGDTASAAEAAANLTAQAGGKASYEVKNGRIVKVDGQDRANELLTQILEQLK